MSRTPRTCFCFGVVRKNQKRANVHCYAHWDNNGCFLSPRLIDFACLFVCFGLFWFFFNKKGGLGEGGAVSLFGHFWYLWKKQTNYPSVPWPGLYHLGQDLAFLLPQWCVIVLLLCSLCSSVLSLDERGLPWHRLACDCVCSACWYFWWETKLIPMCSCVLSLYV